MRSAARALSLFTVVPVRGDGELTPRDAAAALRWLPAIGAVIGAACALPLAAIHSFGPDGGRGAAVGAVLAVALLALVTRGLHLDGLADTADGLGSRAPADRALEIMRRSDIGPFGVVTLVLVLLADVLALATVGGNAWTPVAALAVAAATGRVAVLAAAHRRVPSARGSGFGAFVAGSVPTSVLVAWTVVAIGGGGLLAAVVGADVVGWMAAQAVALALTAGFLAHCLRRLGGVTGDVFGALVELATALTLAGLVLAG